MKSVLGDRSSGKAEPALHHDGRSGRVSVAEAL